VKSGTAVRQDERAYRVYDCFAAERSLRQLLQELWRRQYLSDISTVSCLHRSCAFQHTQTAVCRV